MKNILSANAKKLENSLTTDFSWNCNENASRGEGILMCIKNWIYTEEQEGWKLNFEKW